MKTSDYSFSSAPNTYITFANIIAFNRIKTMNTYTKPRRTPLGFIPLPLELGRK